MLLPYKYSRLDTKTVKVYEHIYTEEEMKEIDERLKKGEDMQIIMKSFRERFTDKDWVEA